GADRVVLPVLDGDRGGVVAEGVADDLRVVAVAAPNAVPALQEEVVDEVVAAEGGLDAVGGGVAEVVAIEQVVVAAAFAGIHRRLAGPKEEAVAAVGHGVVGEDVSVGLLIDQDAGGVLASVVDAVAEASDAPVDLVVHDDVVGALVHAEPD